MPSDYLLYNKLRNYKRLLQLHHRLVPIRCRSRQRRQTEIILRVRFDVVPLHLSSLQRSGGSLSSIQLACPFISPSATAKSVALTLCSIRSFSALLLFAVHSLFSRFTDSLRLVRRRPRFLFRRFSICNTLE